MFEQDPFDRWCLALFSELQYIARCVPLLCTYIGAMTTLHIRHYIRIFLIEAEYVCRRVFGTSFGLHVKSPTWSEIENLRRQLVRETGVWYPRSKQLEEGLKSEQDEESED